MTAENPAGGPEPAKSQPGQGGALIERQETLPSTLLLNEPRPEEDEDGINLRDYWNIIVKRKWTVLTFFLITVTAVMTATFLQTKIYRASMTLQIEQQEAKLTKFDDVTPNETDRKSVV